MNSSMNSRYALGISGVNNNGIICEKAQMSAGDFSPETKDQSYLPFKVLGMMDWSVGAPMAILTAAAKTIVT